MNQWDDFRYFLALQRNMTLKASARELKVDQATVGRRIQTLEDSLGTQLFEKRSDGYFLTLAGERVLPTLKALEEGIHSVERLIAGQEERIEGIVKIAMPGALANHWLIPKLQPFIQKHSQIKFEFLTGPEAVNLSRREADLAIRLVRPTQRDLVVKKIGEIQLSLYGHPSLFTSTRRPATKEDLKKFPFIGLFPNSMSELEKQLLKKIEPHLHCTIRSGAWSSVFYSIQSGLGIGILPSFLAERDSKLVQLQVIESGRTPLWLVAHPDIVHSARVRAVIDYVITALK
ncbi:MAG: LysR family transcriptional regulator [Bdellovibrionaceae bacterium]|nr:LysR family transcriptional regulator [Pseudobdellovibrionaceae bacterium]